MAHHLLGDEIAENIGIYYNEGKPPKLKETDDLEQARRFLIMAEEAETVNEKICEYRYRRHSD